MLRIGMVAGEVSGDLLGAGLVDELSKMTDGIIINGVGGDRLIAAGMKPHCHMELLSVMGITEVLGHYRALRRARDRLRDYFIQNPPDVFIGIDAPDFNLGLEKDLRLAGIKTVHYVSPSVWAWREYRINKIKQSVDLMLTLFPFENEIYDKYGVPNRYVGHPLADQLQTGPEQELARKELGVPLDKTVIALLPGSRLHEINNIGPVFLSAARLLNEKNLDLYFLSGLANQRTFDRFLEIVSARTNEQSVDLHLAKTHRVIEAADYVLLASGTATLEAMLLVRPMVVAYRLSWITYWIVKSLAKISYASLPNILAGKQLVTECLQKNCNAEKIAKQMQLLLDNVEKTATMKKEFEKLSIQLAVNANCRAARAVYELVNER